MKKQLLIVKKQTITITSISIVTILMIVAGGVFTYYASLPPEHDENVAVSKVEALIVDYPIYSSVDEMQKDRFLDVIVEGMLLDNGTSIVTPMESPAPPYVNTHYKLRVDDVLRGDNIPKNITVSIMGGIINGTKQIVENAPELHRGDRVIIFAAYGKDDDIYSPLSAGTAIAKHKVGDYYAFTKASISGERLSFSKTDIRR